MGENTLKNWLAAGLIAGSSALWSWYHFKPVPPLDPASITINEIDEVHSTQLRVSPNGKKVAFCKETDDESHLELFVVNKDGSDLEKLTNDQFKEANPVWISNNEVRFLSSDEKNQNKIVNIHDKSIRSVPPMSETKWHMWLLSVGVLGAGMAGLYLYDKFKKNKNGFFASTYERPLAASFIGYASGLTYLESLLQVQPLYKDTPPQFDPLLVVAAPLAGFGAHTLATRLKHFKASPGYDVAIQMQDYFKEGDFDNALICFSDFLNHVRERQEQLDFMNRFSAPLFMRLLRDSTYTKVKPLYKHMSYALSEAGFGQLHHANKQWGKVHEIEDSVETRAAHALYLEEVLKSEPFLKKNFSRQHKKVTKQLPLSMQVEEEWKKAIDHALEDEDEFKRIGASRNQVLEYNRLQFLKGLFVFKRSDNEYGLDLERKTIEHYQKIIPHNMPKVLGFVPDHEGLSYLIERRAAKDTLWDRYLEDKTNTRLLVSRTVPILAMIHADGPGGTDPRLLDKNYFSKRFDDIVFKNIEAPPELQQRVKRNMKVVDTLLAESPVGYYKDANLKNWLVEGHNIYAIDFEGDKRLPVVFDLVSLLEFAPLLTENERKREVTKYLNLYLRETKKKINQTDFWFQYNAAAIQRHFELAGYRMRDAKELTNYKEQLKELKHAKYHLERVSAISVYLDREQPGNLHWANISTCADELLTTL